MSLPNYLAKIKHSGIYRFVWDKSLVTMQDIETLRLVVGYSEKGPFNTPVYIKDAGEFKTIFGDINKKLEKRGVFFHRMAIQALAAGPILALNLKKFGNEKVAGAYTANDAGVGGFKEFTANVPDIFNTTRFWTLDPDQLVSKATLPTAAFTDGKAPYFVISATDAKEASCSFIARPCATTGYDVTLKSWFTQLGEDMPDCYAECSDLLVSDFFAEVYVFKGEFTKEIARSQELARFFDVDGDNVTVKPTIVNAFGQPVDALEALAADENSGFVQRYRGVVLPNFKDLQGSYISLDLLFNADHDIHKMMMKLNEDNIDDAGYVKTLVTSGLNKINFASVAPVTTSCVISGPSILSQTAAVKVNRWYLETTTTDESGAGTSYKITLSEGGFEDPNASVICFPSTSGKKGDTVLNLPVEFKGMFVVGQRFIGEADGTIASIIGVDETENGVTVTFDKAICATVPASQSSTPATPDPAPSDDDDEVSALAEDGETTTTSHTWIVRLDSAFTTGSTTPIYLKGYTYDSKPNSNSIPDKLKWQEELLSPINVASAGKAGGLIEALTNCKDVDYRYIVDTFESFPCPECKASLALLAKKKDNAMLLTNFPSVKSFVAMPNNQYTNANGIFSVAKVKSGAFSLPLAENGASWCSFNTPVVLTDGTVKTIVPAAALVSNDFMAKYESRQPYYIVAGPTYGRLTAAGLVGPDYNYTSDELDILEPMGVNATVYVPRKGTFINSNQTAKQTPVTGLSKINVRELCIYLQDTINSMLLDYQWEFNTPSLRQLIKQKADKICENVQANGGIYDFENVCDESNNTDDVINNEMIVLSTYIEPGMGAGKMVQELTLFAKGGMRVNIKNA